MRTDLSEVIAENFGANATYVEGLLSRFRSNPELVDESWRTYFAELLGDGGADGRTETPAADQQREGRIAENGARAAAPAPAVATKAAAPVKSEAPATAVKPTPSPTTEPAEVTPIRGAALKIVENMEASLAVPTATSQRRIPVKLLDENRRLINKHLQGNDRGKASYTHVIAWALLRALDEFPQLNDGFDVIDGNPVRLQRSNINLGVAIDLIKKDGTRTLLVPNIKNANKLRFSEFRLLTMMWSSAREGKLQIADFRGTTISLSLIPVPSVQSSHTAFDGRPVTDCRHRRD